MNLYDSSRVIPHSPELRFFPDGSSQRVPSCWGPPRLQLFDSESASRLMAEVNDFLACPDVHICAVSPAAVCALRESESPGNPLLMPHYTITVLYQQRTPHAAAAPVREAA